MYGTLTTVQNGCTESGGDSWRMAENFPKLVTGGGYQV